MVVVDLTTGESHRYDVPGPNVAVVWQDPGHLVVSEEGAGRSRVLDLSDGSVSASSFTASTGFAPDGSWVTWGRSRQLTSDDGTRVLADVANAGGLQLTSPLVDDAVAVGLGGLDLTEGSRRAGQPRGLGDQRLPGAARRWRPRRRLRRCATSRSCSGMTA